MKSPTKLKLSDLAVSELLLLDDDGEPVMVVFIDDNYLSIDVRRQCTARVFHKPDGKVTTRTDIDLPEVTDPTFNYAVTDWRQK